MAVLVISGAPKTHARLRHVLRALRLQGEHANGLRDARLLLTSRPWPVVVTEASLPDGDWRAVLELLPAQGARELIVTSRLADERLWSEVLQRGGFDVLAQPFDDGEVARVLSIAHRRSPGEAFPESSQPIHAPLTLAADN